MVTKGHGEQRGQRTGAIDGGNIWWIAPTFPIASDIWRDLKRSCRDAWTSKSEVERRIELHGGGAVTVKSADNPDSLRGAGLDGVVIDEAASVKQAVWQEAVRPALSDKQGWAVFIGTPKGFNWFYDLFRNADGREDWERWQRPSSDNPLLTAKELEDAKRELGSLLYSQEYEAQFQADGLGVFQRDWFPIVEAVPDGALRAVRGWDLAATEGGGDYTAGALLVEQGGIYYVAHVARGQWSVGKRDQRIVMAGNRDAERWDDYTVVLEQEPGSSGVSAVQYLMRQMPGLAVVAERPTGAKEVRSRPFAAQAEAGNVRLIRGEWNREFLDELCMFPTGQYDDQVDAVSSAFNRLAKPTGRLLTRPLLTTFDDDELEAIERGDDMGWFSSSLAWGPNEISRPKP